MVKWSGPKGERRDKGQQPSRGIAKRAPYPGKKMIAGKKVLVKGIHFCSFLCWDDEPWVEIRGAAFEEGRCVLTVEMVEELTGHVTFARQTLREAQNP